MQIELNKLPHQQEALNAIISVFLGKNHVKILKNHKHPNSNPLLETKYKEIDLIPNIKEVQKSIPNEMRGLSQNTNPLVLDVKMETGTGKTCVYTELMYKLNELGFNKFVIIVPTTAIREGTKNFIEAEYSKAYFKRHYENKKIVLTVFEAQKQSKGKKQFPASVREYFNGSILHQNKIYTLLIGQGMLKKNCTMGMEFDQLIDVYTKPCEAIASTRPIVIIDEPHKFDRTKTTYKFITENLNPQMIIRFGATFPIKKDKTTDYENLIFDLNAIKAFNDNLIKGVDTEYIDGKEDVKIKVTEISNTKNDKYAVFKNEKTGKTVKLKELDDLSIIDSKIADVKIESIGKDEETSNSAVFLSNDMVLSKADIFYPEIFGGSYQEKMLRLALERHFETELNNIERENPIKSLALFFIDNIESYRNGTGGKGNLRILFEELLSEYLKKQIEKVNKEIEKGYDIEWYKKYLKDSLENISETNGGYFCQDNSTSPEDVKKEVDDILRNKEKLLSFVDDNGKYNLRRFLFSKWTLKEGWDNPNVFTIAKLRSSGSEISKLQEVGRGLRLPVDNDGSRINEQFYLNYIIDYSEHDFAEKLIKEVNKEAKTEINIEQIIKDFAEKNGISWFSVANNLTDANIIDARCMLKMENYSSFPEKYKEIKDKIEELEKAQSKLNQNKIRNKNKKENTLDKVKIREKNFKTLRKLWEALNTKYYVKFEELPENEIIEQIVLSLDKYKDIVNTTETIRTKTEVKNNSLTLISNGLNKHSFTDDSTLPYGEFLKAIAKRTNIPINVIHKAIIKFNKEIRKTEDKFFNKYLADKIIQDCQENWKQSAISKYSYEKLENVNKKETALTYKNGNVKEYVLRADVGVKMLSDLESPDKFLYELPVYDSDIEKNNLENSENISEIEVFAKIPRRSIKIPTYFGETYSPDFMYVVKKNTGTPNLNCIIETKGINSQDDKRIVEKRKIECAKRFYQKLQEDFKDKDFKIIYREQNNTDKLNGIIKELISKDI